MAVAALTGDVSADRGSLKGHPHDRKEKRDVPLSHSVPQDGCGSQHSDEQASAAAYQIAFSSNQFLAGSTIQHSGYEAVRARRSAPGLHQARVHMATEPGRYAAHLPADHGVRLAETARTTKSLMGQRRPIGCDAVIDSWRGISVLMVFTRHQLASRPREVYPVIAPKSLGLPSGDVSCRPVIAGHAGRFFLLHI